MNNSPYPKGSEWRKWDLHIHSPGTKINNQYKIDGVNVLEEFCKKIEQSDVQVFGIVDYFSADGYFSFIEKFKGLYPASKKVFFPNVELRTSYVVNSAQQEVNLHIIFNSFDAEIGGKIKSFLQFLDTNKTTDGSRRIKASELSSINDFEEATTTREFIEEAFRHTFGDKAELTDFILIFTAANNDGIRSKSGVKRKAIITDELDKFSYGFFGNSNNTEYFLNRNRLEGDEEVDAKPVVSGCDAHSFVDLDAWLGKFVMNNGEILKQPTWIKADLTFEGLKQIIYEPRERVFIGEEPEIEIRVRSNKTKYIKSLHINKTDEYDGRHGAWFDSEKIDFNQELVAIIGNKGSGKSAVTDIIGLLGNSYNQKHEIGNNKVEELFSFLNQEKFIKNHCASNFEGQLHWHAGQPDIKLLDKDIDKNFPEKVEYLPQKYLEKICANIDDDEFRSKLNKVIFGYVKKQNRYGRSSLEELIAYLASQTEEDIKITKDVLHQANTKVISVEKKLTPDYKKVIEEKKRIKEEEVITHQKIKPKEVQKPTQDSTSKITNTSEITTIETELNNLNKSIPKLELEEAEVNKKIQDFTAIKQAIVRQVISFSDLKVKYEEQLKIAEIKFDDLVAISQDYTKIDNFIDTNKNRLVVIIDSLRTEEEINSLGLDEVKQKEVKEKSLKYRLSQIERQKKNIIDLLDKPNQEYQIYLKEKEKWDKQYKDLVGDETHPAIDTLNWLKQELVAIDSTYLAELVLVRNERKNVAKDFFKNKIAMASFYDSVKKSIDGEIGKYTSELGDYDISIEATLRFNKDFYEEFFRFVNQIVKGSFRGTEDGRRVLKKIIEEVTDWQNEEMVLSFLDSIVAHIDNDNSDALTNGENRTRDVFKQMKQGKDPVAFYDYIFGFDYLGTKYDLRVDEKDLSQLSPGERGGLLLIFYLMLDINDIPLVIDQPEDNLDNKSIYEILVTFLKKAKKRRQIIMVTHNPNLAVVADAEQIIHVSIDKKNKNDFDFYSGAIENPKVNKSIVDILEGTLPAFDNRRLKYRKQVNTTRA